MRDDAVLCRALPLGRGLGRIIIIIIIIRDVLQIRNVQHNSKHWPQHNHEPDGMLQSLLLVLRSIIGQPGIYKVQLRTTSIQLGKRGGFNDLGYHLGLTTGTQVSVCKAPKSFYMLHNALDWYRNDSGETTVVMGGWNQVAGLWGRPPGGHWPL